VTISQDAPMVVILPDISPVDASKPPAGSGAHPDPASSHAMTWMCGTVIISIAVSVLGLWLWVWLTTNTATCDRPLRLWGLVNLCSSPATLIAVWGAFRADVQDHVLVLPLRVVASFAAIFQPIWFFIGNAWTFSTSPQTCDSLLYSFSFWYIIAVYVTVTCYCLCGCVCAAYQD
jgi:hypothetical protein